MIFLRHLSHPIKGKVNFDFHSDVQFLLEHSIAKALTKGLLTSKKVNVPSIETIFVNIDEIVLGEEEFLAEMKSNLLEGLEVSIIVF